MTRTLTDDNRDMNVAAAALSAVLTYTQRLERDDTARRTGLRIRTALTRHLVTPDPTPLALRYRNALREARELAMSLTRSTHIDDRFIGRTLSRVIGDHVTAAS